MNYLSKNNYSFSNRKRHHHWRWLVIVFVIVGLLFSIPATRGVMMFLARPIWKIERALLDGLSSSWSLLSSKRTLVEENRRLSEENSKSEYYILVNNFLRNENDQLHDLLGRKSDKNTHSIMASVLIKPGRSPYDILIIDAGSNYNVSVGDLVSIESVVVGDVTEVYAETSKVELYSTPGKNLPVLIGPNSIQGEALGLGGGNFRVKLPKETEIKEGDSIVIPSITSNVFGVVEKIISGDNNTFQDIYFKTPFNLSELKFIEILKNAKIN